MYVHRTLLAFNAATVNEFIKRSKKLDEGTGVMLVSALLEPLQSQKGEEAISKDAIVSDIIIPISSFVLSLFGMSNDVRFTHIYLVGKLHLAGCVVAKMRSGTDSNENDYWGHGRGCCLCFDGAIR